MEWKPVSVCTQLFDVHVFVPRTEEPAAQVHPTCDPYQSTPAALVYVAHFAEVIAWVLDQPLPFPIHRPEAIRSAYLTLTLSSWIDGEFFLCPCFFYCSEHGFLVKRKRSFLNSMAKLDDNIMYLCFTQVRVVYIFTSSICVLSHL